MKTPRLKQEAYLCFFNKGLFMELYYRTEGEPGKPSLLILHGLYGMSDNWVSLARRYAASFHVILPDLRNHGLSPHHPVHTYEVMVQDIEALIHKLQLDDFNLMGHSMGGKVAMLVALRNPEKVRRLIIADIGPGPTPGANLHRNIGQALLSINPLSFASRTEIGKALLETIGNPAITQLMLKNIAKDDTGRFHWKPNLTAILNHLDNIAGAIHLEGFYTNPALLLKGESSDYVKEEDIDVMLQHFILLREETIPQAGHWLHADNPEAFFKISYQFFM
jgi:pimeloyl-ACP methyl ester carboxylesterase